MSAEPYAIDESENWKVVCQSTENSLVLYNSSSSEIRTVAETKSNPLPVPWTSPTYFEILAKHFSKYASFSLRDSLTNGYFNHFFTNHTKIGSGGYGSVYRVEHILAGIHLGDYAVKVIPFGELAWLEKAINEVKLFEKLARKPHPLIIGYKHCWIEEWQPATYGPQIPCLFILMEYAQGGTVEKWLEVPGDEGKFRALPEKEAWQIFLNIATAVHYLHRLGIMHRDIKLSNVLIFEEPANSPLPMRMALSDFGTSVDVFERQNRPRTGATGTIETMAPELLMQDECGRFMYKHTFASDIWSLGVILFSLFYHCNPFVKDEGQARLKEFTTVENLVAQMGLQNVEVPKLARSLLRHMMTKDPRERWQVDKIMQMELVHEMTVEFGLDKLMGSVGPVVMVSPSMDDLNSSVKLPLLDATRKTVESQTEKEEKKPREFQGRYIFGLLLAHMLVLLVDRTDWVSILPIVAVIAAWRFVPDMVWKVSGDLLWCAAAGLVMLIGSVVGTAPPSHTIGVLVVFAYACFEFYQNRKQKTESL